MNADDIRFAADGMLQALATWLRVLGYDCLAGRDCFGRRLLEQAVADERVFLTRHLDLENDWPRALLERAQVVYVASEHLPAQLREVVGKFSLDPHRSLFTRCVLCNQPLRPVTKAEVLDRIPPTVAALEEDFWRCARCGRVFWRGTHVRNSRQRLERWLAG